MSMAVTTGAGSRERGRRATASDRSRQRTRAVRQPRGADSRRRGAAASGRSAARGSALDVVREKVEVLLGCVSRFRVAFAVAAAVIVVIAALYSPAQGLYCAWRDNVVRQQELAELTEANEEYQTDIDRLQTREGIEDEARRRGYVAEGESEIVVDGTLPEDEEQDDAETEDVPWYVALGDLVFQYD